MSAALSLRYFFKLDKDGDPINWQIAEGRDTAERLLARGYTEVTRAAYVEHWKALDYWAMAGMSPALQEREV